MIAGSHHVKLPVSDLDRSRHWYTSVLGLRVDIEFVEDGVVQGVALSDESGSVRLALRRDAARAEAMAGFDAVALAVPTREAVEVWRRRLRGPRSAARRRGDRAQGRLGPRRPPRPRRHRDPPLRRLTPRHPLLAPLLHLH